MTRCHYHRLGHEFEEVAELADDESEQDNHHPPSPTATLSVPSLSPVAYSQVSGSGTGGEARNCVCAFPQATHEDRVNVSIAAGQGLRISVSGSTWPHTMTYPPSLLLDRETMNNDIDDSD